MSRPTKLLAALVLAGLLPAARASDAATGDTRVGILLQGNAYRESVMKMSGAGAGLRLDRLWALGGQGLRLEGEFSVGESKYSSSESGIMNGIERMASAWHVSSSAAPSSRWAPKPGLALTTDWTDLRGRTSNGSTGYERFNTSMWLTGEWLFEPDRTEGPTRVRLGLLVRGWHRSMFSQAQSGLADITNQQNRGVWLSVEQPLKLGDVPTTFRVGWKVYGQSDTRSISATRTAYEPSSRSVEVGLTVWQ